MVCLVKKIAEDYRKCWGLPADTIVPVHINCDCEKCKPRFTV